MTSRTLSVWSTRWTLCVLFLSGCTTTTATSFAPSQRQTQPMPTLQGSYHVVQRGETLWRIAHAYGLDAQTLASVNRVPSAQALQVGQRLFIPLPLESGRFLWPLRGTLKTSRGGSGVAIAAPIGSLVRASRSGRVAVAAQQLSGWGKMVLLDHFDGYLTVYLGLDQILVSPGGTLRQGMPIGRVGQEPLYFEIRYGAVPKNTLAILPNDS